MPTVSVDQFLAACSHSNRQVKILLNLGADVNGEHGLIKMTGLMIAMGNGDTEIVETLLGCENIEINKRNVDGWTALHYACFKNQMDCVELFLAHPDCTKDIVRMKVWGNITGKDKFCMIGCTAYMMAKKMDSYGCALLISIFYDDNGGNIFYDLGIISTDEEETSEEDSYDNETSEDDSYEEETSDEDLYQGETSQEPSLEVESSEEDPHEDGASNKKSNEHSTQKEDLQSENEDIFEDAQESWQLDADEKLKQAKICKEEGTAYFKDNNFEIAATKYQTVIDFLVHDISMNGNSESERKSLLQAGRLNLALCYLKLAKWLEAKSVCDKAIDEYGGGAKAWFRRGEAQLALNNYKDAKSDFVRSLELEPENKAAKNKVAICEQRIKGEEEKNKFANMFGKSKKEREKQKNTSKKDIEPEKNTSKPIKDAQTHKNTKEENMLDLTPEMNDTKNKAHNGLEKIIKVKMELEKEIAEKREKYVVHEQKVEDVIDVNATKIKDLILMLEKFQDGKEQKIKEVKRIDENLSTLENRIKELKLKKVEVLKEYKDDDEMIQNYLSKKQTLDYHVEKEMEMYKEEGDTIKKEIRDLESRKNETNAIIDNLSKEMFNTRQSDIPVEPNNQLLKIIDDEIGEKERRLECPVCLEVAESPIFMCSEQHLICSACRPKLKECPECRQSFEEKSKRHRYAEETSEELVRLKERRRKVLISSCL